MLIDCDTCAVRGSGCADCVVTVLLGAPPARQSGPVVVPLSAPRVTSAARTTGHESAGAVVAPGPGVVVEFDEVERRAVRALAEGGLIPPLRHQQERPAAREDRRTG